MGGQTAISVANSISTVILPVTPMRVSLAASGSIRLGATVAFSSQASAWGKLMARRAR
jgi:hypothetical protein